MKWHPLLLATLLALPDRATAQQQPAAPPPTTGIVRNGKWGAAALFVAATTIGFLEHNRADNAFDDLRTLCGNAVQCTIGPDGHYTDSAAEAQYQRIVAGDRAARSWFIGGQVALAGTAALFVIELLHARGAPNIPYSGFIVKPTRDGTRIGWRLPIRLP